MVKDACPLRQEGSAAVHWYQQGRLGRPFCVLGGRGSSRGRGVTTRFAAAVIGKRTDVPVPFPSLTEGPDDGELVLLLHGFPQSKDTWREVMRPLAEAGYRTVAYDQRGYRELHACALDALRLDGLADDALAVADALGQERFHIVGHDWGGAVAWHLAANSPERLLTANIVATPHPRAMLRSMVGTQVLRSLYMVGFQVPVVPEALLRARRGALLRVALRRSGLSTRHAVAYTDALLEGSKLTNALGWYRANVPGSVRSIGPSHVPTLYIWPDRDVALGRQAAERTADHVQAPYRFVVLEGAPHWAPEERPADVAALVLDHLRTATSRTCRFGPLVIAFDDRVLVPRPWTALQSEWAAELSPDLGPGPILELFAGVGHIGLLASVLTGRALVQVEADAVAARFAEENAARAGIADRVQVRQARIEDTLQEGERFSLVVADPPYLRRAEVGRFPADPVTAIDGGEDGLDLVRATLDLLRVHLADDGICLLQLGGPDQVREVETLVRGGWPTLEVRKHRTVAPDRAVVLIARS